LPRLFSRCSSPSFVSSCRILGMVSVMTPLFAHLQMSKLLLYPFDIVESFQFRLRTLQAAPRIYMIVHPQHPLDFSPPSTSILDVGPFDPLPPEMPSKLPDICLLYLRISRTISQNALSTLMRDFADVSMNLQPNCLAKSAPSVRNVSVCASICCDKIVYLVLILVSHPPDRICFPLQ
jgi:hypothetical protein